MEGLRTYLKLKMDCSCKSFHMRPKIRIGEASSGSQPRLDWSHHNRRNLMLHFGSKTASWSGWFWASIVHWHNNRTRGKATEGVDARRWSYLERQRCCWWRTDSNKLIFTSFRVRILGTTVAGSLHWQGTVPGIQETVLAYDLDTLMLPITSPMLLEVILLNCCTIHLYKNELAASLLLLGFPSRQYYRSSILGRKAWLLCAFHDAASH